MNSIAQRIQPEFDSEMANTRKVLERLPDDKLNYKPHAKSGDMLWLAAHISNLPLWAATACKQDALDIAPADGSKFELPAPKSRAEVLANFDSNVAQAREAVAKVSDEEMMKQWRLLKGGQEILAMPRVAVVRSMVVNHIIHHRAQLTVYYRLNDIPVPALYGPSADEGKF